MDKVDDFLFSLYLEIIPIATPLFFVNHCGAMATTLTYMHEIPIPNMMPCVK